jgi:3-deoxy-D-manno-octulosonic-acid transferase
LYDIFFLVFGILYLPCVVFGGKMHRGFSQKLGAVPPEVRALKKPVWIHAVSVGEAALAARLAVAVKERFPAVQIAVSTTTRTGNEMIRKAAGAAADAVFYYPFDVSVVVYRAVRLIDPAVYVMVETELWPNLLAALRKRRVPIVLVNGRISDGSFSGYSRIRYITRRMLSCVSRCCMQSGRDAERIMDLGASGEIVKVTGNMKFDEAMPSGEPEIGRQRCGFGADDEVFVAGSTHAPEETGIIKMFARLKTSRPGLKMVLAPRHVERVEEVKSCFDGAGVGYRCLSEILAGGAGPRDALLVDTIGHLRDMYGIASVVFVGGSIAEKGGQNPIEAARWSKPVIFGPHMFNFREVSGIFLRNGAAVEVRDLRELERALCELLDDTGRRQRMSAACAEVIGDNAGAIGKTVDEIAPYLSAGV